jgi:hypothetical protein
MNRLAGVRAVSSVVEHRLYTPAVTGSNPVPPSQLVTSNSGLKHTPSAERDPPDLPDTGPLTHVLELLACDPPSERVVDGV